MRRPAPRVSTTLPASSDPIERVAGEIASRLDLAACRFEVFPFDALLPRIEPGRVVIPAAQPGVRPYTDWRPSDGVELPIRYGALTLGRFVLVPRIPTCGVEIPPDLRTDALRLARLAGDALRRRWTATDDLARER